MPKDKYFLYISILLLTFSLPSSAKKKAVPTFPLAGPKGTFPLDFSKFGTFTGVGTENYKYKITDRTGLRKAMGATLYPNTNRDLFNDPNYKKWRKAQLGPVNPWEYVNTGNPQSEYYAWATSNSTTLGTKLYFSAQALAEGGRYHLALKAYHAVLVHFPREACWSEDRSFVWYPAQKALSEILSITRQNPKIGYRLKDAVYEIKNEEDTDLKNDIIIVNPGHWEKYDPNKKIDLNKLKIVNRRGSGKVRLVQYENKHWQLLVDDEPFFVQGVTYNPTKVGRDIADTEGSRWMHEDANNNGWVDTPYDSWFDANKNGRRDSNETIEGDIEILNLMGANAIRIFRMNRGLEYNPKEFNKKVLRDLHQRHGIYVIMGEFLGAYTIGSGAEWDIGTDYKSKEQLASMENLLTEYVLDHKDEPYVLMWVLGNENLLPSDYNSVNATRTLAHKQVKEYLTFVDKMAKLIHQIDPHHPVAVGNLGLASLEEHAQYAPNVDIFGTNSYRGSRGFGDLWGRVREIFDRPVLITEYGCDAYNSRQNAPDEEGQAKYHRAAWKDIVLNSAGGVEQGNSIGGVVFEYVDEWWKSHAGSWTQHDTSRDSSMPFPDGWSSEEWLGVLSQGNGKKSPFLRQPRKAFYLYKNHLWKKK
ncbi:hypothetical protein BVX98_06270 [bacterium F11]|nr:hypothetical protein BVX98_06270 [bacterium F11]